MSLKSGIFAGIIAYIVAFIYEIPIYPPENWVIDFKIFTFKNADFYFWGYVTNENIVLTSIIGFLPESLISIIIWLMVFYIGLSSIMASTSKAKSVNSLKLFKINILLLILLLSIFGIIIVILILEDLNSLFNIIGLGYYLTITVLILNIIALKKAKKL